MEQNNAPTPVNASAPLPVENVKTEDEKFPLSPEEKAFIAKEPFTVSKKVALVLLCILVVLVIVGGALIVGSMRAKDSSKSDGVPVEQPTSQPLPTTAPTPIDETADWKTYRNEEYGFKFKYPKSTTLTVNEPNNANDGWTQLILGDDQNRSFYIAASNIYNRDPNLSVKPSNGQKIINGNTWMTYEFVFPDGNVDSKDALVGLQLEHNGVLYSSQILVPGKLAATAQEEVLSTFRFLDEDSSVKTTEKWSLYENSELGFSIRYPSDLIMQKEHTEYDGSKSILFSEISELDVYPTYKFQVTFRSALDPSEAMMSEVPIDQYGNKETPSTIFVAINNATGIEATSNFVPSSYWLKPVDTSGPILKIYYDHQDKELEAIFKKMFETFRFL